MKILLILILLITTTNTKEYDKWDNMLKGNHELRKFGVSTTKGSSFSASYFLIAGSASGGSYTETTATFSWKAPNGEYIISKLPIHKIRVKIDNSVKKPYVKFRWRGSFGWGNKIRTGSTVSDVFESNIIYMVIVCSEEDYPINIDMSKL